MKVPDTSTASNQIVYGSFFYDVEEFVINLDDTEATIGLKKTSVPGIYVLAKTPEEVELTVNVSQLTVNRRQVSFPVDSKNL